MRKNQFISDIKRKKLQRNTTLTLIGLAALIAISYSVAGVEDKSDSQTIIERVGCKGCHNRQTQMTEYFKKAGSKSPEEMAVAVLNTKSPRLLAAIHVKGEKCTPYTVRRGGFKGEHAGAWQMNERIHGKQPYDPIGQALNAEKYLVELSEDKPIKTALNIFGGDKTKKTYANSILSELERVP